MDMVKIYRATNQAEADFLKSFLEGNGIEVFIQGYHHRSLLGMLGPYVQLDLMVSQENQEEAEKLVTEYREGQNNEPDKIDGETEEKPPLNLRPKNMAVAVMLALILPGAGSIYAGSRNFGQWILMGTIICYVSIFMLFDIYGPYPLLGVFTLVLADMAHAIKVIYRAKGRTRPTCSSNNK